MSDSSPNPPAVPPQNQQQRSGCLTALMAIAGIFMLLPGLCALLFGECRWSRVARSPPTSRRWCFWD
ncbi:hypothetical protein [Bradyrhizobium sp. 23AC]